MLTHSLLDACITATHNIEYAYFYHGGLLTIDVKLLD